MSDESATAWPYGDGEMAECIRTYDWATTPLGPIEAWPQSLKTIVDLMLASPSMMSLVWGAEAIHLYNDAFTELLREHRLTSLGRSAFETFARSRDVFAADIAAGMAGESARLMAQRYPVLRNGQLENAWFDVDYMPVRDEAGTVAGVLWSLKETTAQILTERVLRESEARHRLLIGSWAQAVWETDAAGVVVADSPSWRAYTGQTIDEWLGYGWLDAVHPDDRAYAERQWREAIAARGLVDAEFRLRAHDGGWRWTNVRAAPVLDAAGQIEKWAGMNMDIDARKRADNLLREREADLARVQRIGEVGGLDIDVTNGLTSQRSPEYLRLHGLPPSHAQEVHEQWLERVHPDDREAAERQLFAALASNDGSYAAEYRIIRPSDSEVRWIEARADIERGQDGKAIRLVGAHLDITDQKRAQEALRDSEERLRGVLDGMAEGFGLLAPDFTILEHNAEALRMGGRLREEVIGRSHWDVYPGSEDSELGRLLKRAMTERVPVSLEHNYEWENGRALWLDMRAYPTADGALAVFWRDVTDRKEAETALRQSEAKYRSLFSSMDEAYAVVEVLKGEAGSWADFRFIEVNPAFIKHTSMPWPVGQTATELLGRPNPRWTELYGKALDTGAPIRVEESEPTLDRVFDLNIFALDRERDRVAVLFTNITERKRAEAALRASEKRYRTLFEEMNEGFALCELVRDTAGRAVDFRYVELNPALMRHVGINPETLRGRLAKEAFPNRDPWYVETYARVVESGQAVLEEHYFLHVGRWLRICVFPRGDDRFAVLYSDISERKRAEATLRAREERQAFLLRFTDAIRSEPNEEALIERAVRMLAEELAIDRAYATKHVPAADLTNVVFEVRRPDLAPLPTTLRFSDFPEAGRQTFEKTLIFEDTANDRDLTEADKAALASMGVGAFLSRPLRRDGSPIFALGVVSTAPRCWTPSEIALVEEATERTWEAAERLRGEAALRESEKHLEAELRHTALLRDLAARLVTEESFQAIYDEVLSAAVTITQADAGTIQIYDPGTKTLELIASLNFSRAITDYFHRVDAGSRTACGVALKTGELALVDFPDEDADYGCQLLVGEGIQAAIAVPLISRAGAPLGMLNAHWRQSRHRPNESEMRFLDLLARQAADLIEQRRSQNALRENEERFRSFGEASTDVLWIRDAETMNWTYLTPAFEKIYGLDREKALAGDTFNNWLDLIVDEDRERAGDMIRSVKAGASVTFEYRVRRPSDGQIRWLRNTDFPIRNAEGRVTAIGGVGHDATQEKEAEYIVRESEAQLQVMVAELQHRTRNLIAVVSSIARQTMADTGPTEAFRAAFADRMEALSRVQGLLSQAGDERVTVGEILELELAALGAHETGDRVRLDGPEVPLRKSIVQTLALAIHELATNARKYGALSNGSGELDVRWTTSRSENDERRLLLEWIENGIKTHINAGEAVTQGSGYGRKLIEKSLPYTLKAKTTYELSADGLRCTIDLPLTKRISKDQRP